MTVPRKLPRTQDQRVQNVSRNHAAQSLGGSTAAARPVANVKPDVKLYQPSSGSNVVTGTIGDPTAIAIAATISGDGGASADGVQSVAIGDQSAAAGIRAVVVGSFAAASGDYSAAYGRAASAQGYMSSALGPYAQAQADGAVAVGTDSSGGGAVAANENDFVLGTVNHHVIVPGALILSDGGTLYRLTVTGGVLGVVAYP